MSQTVTPHDLCKVLGIGAEVDRVLGEWSERLAVGGDRDRVLSLTEWAKLANISPRTARDVIARGEASDLDELAKSIVMPIQAVEGVTRTLTCPVLQL